LFFILHFNPFISRQTLTYLELQRVPCVVLSRGPLSTVSWPS